HLQDCGSDYKNLNRVYLPCDALAAAGASVEALGQGRASPQLLQCLHSLAARTQALLEESKSLSAEVKDFRLGLEISVIQAFAGKSMISPIPTARGLSGWQPCNIGGMTSRRSIRAIRRRGYAIMSARFKDSI